ncbi:GPI2-domain-containing protein [Aureobasidium pullulans]|nr:GPI2-domain-containing protein [Aureobasidium pullulans]
MPPFEAPVSASASDASISRGGTARSASSHLRPEDAFLAYSPPYRSTSKGGASENRRKRDSHSSRNASRRRPRTWKKLLWVKQAYPDNYTDEETFLDHLQRNPRLRPYDFWPLVADSTVIVQHIGSVIIFVCCFIGIFQRRVSPVSVVSWASFGTVLGWVVRDYWVGQEEAEQARQAALAEAVASSKAIVDSQRPQEGPLSPADPASAMSDTAKLGLGISSVGVSRPLSVISTNESLASTAPSTGHPNGAATFASYSYYPPYESHTSSLSARNQERLATAKSALLIYCALLGLSPILKSLTLSTSEDSIWAMSSWLLIINIFTFDYGAGAEAKFPASLSTNAALMASTVLASRLPSTTHVFSLTLFSIEVFGLFPVFRRHVRHVSWTGHLMLTALIILGAGGGLCVTITGGGWKAGVIGAFLGGILTCLAMGITSWWLIGLQRYKNEIHGPWDPARPIIRRHWD